MEPKFVLAACVLMLFGCHGSNRTSQSRDSQDSTADQNLELMRLPDSTCVIVVDVEETPKEEFLGIVKEDSDLDEADKTTILASVAPDIYSRCRCIKFRRGNEEFLLIDQCNRGRQIGKDPAGRPMWEGLAGSKELFTFKNGSWQQTGMHVCYDD